MSRHLRPTAGELNAMIRRAERHRRGEAAPPEETPEATRTARSDLERALHYQLREAPLPQSWVTNLRFLPGYTFEADVAWPEQRIAVEVDGLRRDGRGSHQTEAGVTRDARKLLLATIAGWTLVRLTRTLVAAEEGVELLVMLHAARERETHGPPS